MDLKYFDSFWQCELFVIALITALGSTLPWMRTRGSPLSIRNVIILC